MASERRGAAENTLDLNIIVMGCLTQTLHQWALHYVLFGAICASSQPYCTAETFQAAASGTWTLCAVQVHHVWVGATRVPVGYLWTATLGPISNFFFCPHIKCGCSSGLTMPARMLAADDNTRYWCRPKRSMEMQWKDRLSAILMFWNTDRRKQRNDSGDVAPCIP